MESSDAISRPSGIPRASKLPVLSKRSSQLLTGPVPVETHSINGSLHQQTSRLAKRSSIAFLPRPSRNPAQRSVTPLGRTVDSDTYKQHRPALTARTSSIRSSSSASRGLTATSSREEEESFDRLGSLDSFRSASRQSSYDDVEPIGSPEAPVTRSIPPTKTRKARPSLSDRAIESIQAVPATPKDRRQSNFYIADSPMAPPLRPGSGMSNSNSISSRPGTSDGTFIKPAPPTALKKPASAKPFSRSTNSFGLSQSSATPRTSSLTNKLRNARESKDSQQFIPPSSTSISVTPKSKPPLQTPKDMSSKPVASDNAQKQSSSAALRQQIAAAKAAAKKEREQSMHDSPRVQDDVQADDADPFNQAPKDGKHILRNRIRSARLDGRLNISALQLSEVPDEVMTMYNAASIEQSNTIWAELVDLTRFIAADNSFETLSDKLFPDLSPEELQSEEHAQDGQFGGIEALDLHNNSLMSLPLGLRRLERLTSLNVTHNRLDNSSLDVISQIRTLRELRMGHNGISGSMSAAICSLSSLEVLDLQANRLLALPEAIRELVSLRVLNVSGNQLTSLPMDAISHLPLQELDASSNALIASLFSLGGVSYHQTLRVLNLANNSLAALTFSPELDMPELQSLDVTNNHLTILPSVAGWHKLVALTAGDNKIAEIPAGFAKLKHLRIANFSGNELHILPPEIALMESLTTLILSSNPLRHKKYLTMNATDLRHDLRALLDQSPEDYDDEVASWGTAPEDHFGSGWTLKPGGLLDLSGKNLTDAVNDTLGSFLKSNEVRQLNLQSNKLTTIPPALWLGQDLRQLDLSNNPLEVDYLSDDLELPSLVELAMANCRVTRLEPLLQHLRAPELQSLQISGNRLSGDVPDVRIQYPQLMLLLASDNKFESVSAEVLRGYSTVDLTSNELQSLPAEIGLLWDEGLRSFEVGRNAFRVPGHRVLEKGTQATMRWLKDRIKVSAEDELDSIIN